MKKLSGNLLVLSFLIVGLVNLASAASPEPAQTLIGAKRFIETVSEASQVSPEPAKDPVKLKLEQFRKELDEYRGQQKNLSPEAAAERWTKLWYRYFDVLPMGGIYSGQVNRAALQLALRELVEAIPGPASWGPLTGYAKAPVEKKHNGQRMILAVLAAYLDKGPEQALSTFEGMRKELAGQGESSYEANEFVLDNLRQTLEEASGTEKGMAAFNRALSRPERQYSPLEVPDLVALAGEQKAGELLLKALKTPNIVFSGVKGEETLKLAKKLALEHVGELVSPQWVLVDSPKDVALFEAFDNEFAPDKEGDQEANAFTEHIAESRSNAGFYYVFGLLAASRVDDAVKFALTPPNDKVLKSNNWRYIYRTIEKSGIAPDIIKFCEAVWDKRPDLDLFNIYFQASMAEGHGDRLVNRLEEKLKAPETSDATRPEVRVELLKNKSLALLAVDDVEGALPSIREALSLGNAAGKPDFNAVRKFFILGKLLDRPDLSSEALDAIDAATNGYESQGNFPYEIRGIARALIDYGEPAHAERILARVSAKAVGAVSRQPKLQRDYFISRVLGSGLPVLAEIYLKEGKGEEILYLMENAPWWPAPDVSALTMREDDFVLSAVGGLEASGRREDAVKLLKNHLYESAEDDGAYIALIRLEGAALIPWLDELYARDRYEERPLIWKAKLLLDENRLEEAETTARSALQVDPTDGKQKKGDRIRGYAVLAEILKARGKEEEAGKFASIVRSVRIAEKGDEFYEAGLLTRSRDLYVKAADEFADAYCIQWRLGERLYALGDVEGAKEHYTKAFELMPTQFGELASFCFGCEGVFENKHTQGIAEKVLSQLAETMPEKPQVHFMLGQLHEARGDRLLALKHYREAAQKDPLYLDALVKVKDMLEETGAPRAELDAAALSLFKLDPLGKHTGSSLAGIASMRELWEAVASAKLAPSPKFKVTVELPAAKKFLAERGDRQEDYIVLESWRREPIYGPGSAIARNRVVDMLVNNFAVNMCFDGGYYGD